MTYENGYRFVTSHGHRARASSLPDHIECEAIEIGNGEVRAVWEDVPLTRSDLRDWLGY
jgi:hypothetical protein